MRITVLGNVDTRGEQDWDVVVDQVAGALRRRGHEVAILGVHADVTEVVDGLRAQRPELVFNVLEEFGASPTGNLAIAGLIELLGMPFTGCGPSEGFLGQDKALAKKLLAFDQILFPRFAVFHKDRDFETGGNLRMPLFVKPVAMDSSIGIGKKSLCKDAAQMFERVRAIHEECNDSALAEEYIDGRELYVGVLGNLDAQALPAIELDFSGFPAGAPRIYDADQKWEPEAAAYGKVTPRLAELPDELRARVEKVALDAYRALRVRDYGRVDLRIADTGEIYVLEVNASCYLEEHDEFAMAARAAGLEYDDLIDRIAATARKRYGT